MDEKHDVRDSPSPSLIRLSGDAEEQYHKPTQLPTFISLPLFRLSGTNTPVADSPTTSLRSLNLDTLRPVRERRNTLACVFGKTQSSRNVSQLSSLTLPTIDFSLHEKRNSLPISSPKAAVGNGTHSSIDGIDSNDSADIHLSVANSDENIHEMSTRGRTPTQDNYDLKKRSTRTDRRKSGEIGRLTVVPRMIDDDGALNEHELKILHFSAEGDIEGLQQLFQEQSYYLYPLDVNCVDSLDRTALSLATLNHHVDVIKFLLGEDIQGIVLGDALFYAIQCEFIEAIELLLDKDPQTSLQVQPGTTSPFEPGLTPFMLAAHKNNYKILSILYRFSHRLTFSDNELLLDEGFDPYSWDAVMERLLHYRARASPAFMLLMYNEKGMTWDPLNSSMDLFGELQELAKREREVDEAYLQMAERCETFALQLLQEVRSSNELADLMRYDLDDDICPQSDVTEAEDSTNGQEIESRQQIKFYLKPIEKALKYEMKDFVTSDNSQLALIYIQKGSMFRGLKGIKANLVQILLGFAFPVLSIAFLVAPKSALGSLMCNPTVKFWCWVVSEVVFIFLLLTNTILMQYNVFIDLNWGISPLLCIAYFWILGKFFQEMREIFRQGLKEYLSDIWNWNDMFTVALYTMFMLLRVVHIIQNKGQTRTSTKYWHEDMFDPLPLSDICIAISYILIHMRIMELLRAERTFGPLQVSLNLMLHDAFRFSVIFGIVFLAFGSGITELYTPYGFDKHCSCNETTQCNTSLPLAQLWIPPPNGSNSLPACVACKSDNPISQSVTKFFPTLLEMFWSLFGYGDPVQWYQFNCANTLKAELIAGVVIIGLYHFGAIIVLVNMLIAMMSNSFQKTHDDSEREWKFHRTQLWLKFIRNEIDRPPPMNLIPRWRTIKKCWRIIKHQLMKMFKKCNRSRNENGISSQALERRLQLRRKTLGLNDLSGTSTLFEGESRYSKVLRLVVLRYVKKKVLHDEMVI